MTMVIPDHGANGRARPAAAGLDGDGAAEVFRALCRCRLSLSDAAKDLEQAADAAYDGIRPRLRGPDPAAGRSRGVLVGVIAFVSLSGLALVWGLWDVIRDAAWGGRGVGMAASVGAGDRAMLGRRYDEALGRYRDALKAARGKSRGPVLAKIAECQFYLGDDEACWQTCAKLEPLEPGWADYWRAMVSRRRGSEDGAKGYFRSAAEKGPILVTRLACGELRRRVGG